MDEEKLERAARALAKRQNGGLDEWDALDPELQETLIGEARAAVEAYLSE